MSKRTVSIISIFLLVLLSATLLAACGSNSPTSAPATSAPSSGGSSNGQTLMQERCSVCHSTARITSAHKTADEWKTTVDRMISHGAKLSSQEEQTLVDYLAQTYK
jgi:mono/diheme cytochrome c family protein